jgi:acetyl esterase/lipase
MKEWFVSELRESLATSAHDVQMILNYLSTRGDVDMDRVGMFGDGSGATIAILVAAVDARVKTLDLVDPWGDWPDWIAKSTRIPQKERPDFLKPEWLAAVAPLDPVKWLPDLKTRKVRIQFVKTVGITPFEAQQKMEATAPVNAQIVHYDDSGAFASSNSGGKGFDWIKQQMQAGTVQQYRAASEKKNSQQ